MYPCKRSLWVNSNLHIVCSSIFQFLETNGWIYLKMATFIIHYRKICICISFPRAAVCCLLALCFQKSHLNIFFSFVWRRPHLRWGAAIFWPFAGRPLPLSREGSFSCHACCETGLWFLRSHPKDRVTSRPLWHTRGTEKYGPIV